MKKIISLVLAVIMLFSMFVIPMGATAATPEGNDALTLKTNFPIAESTGANAKFFIDHATYQEYDKNNVADEEWVKGLDYVGLANYKTAESGFPSYPTGADDAVGAGYNNALIYKIDQAAAAAGQWNASFVNLTTKNGLLTWTVDGVEFVINPLEKAIKVYSNVKTEGVTDPDLKARFETLNNPVLDVEDGYYESITVLAGFVAADMGLTPTIVYEDGSEKKLTTITRTREDYAAGTKDTQDAGYMLLQALTNWGNLNDGGTADFFPITLTGFDTTKKIDKISFKSSSYGKQVFIISAFGETASLYDVLYSANTEDYDSVVSALKTVDAILAQNNIEVSDLTAASIKKYNDLKEAEERLANKEIRKEVLSKRDCEYVEIPFTHDAFATAAEVYKYYPRDSAYSVFPSTDVDGKPLTNHINAETLNNKSIGKDSKKVFLIDSILGNESGEATGQYLDASNAKSTYTYTFKVNGNDKFKLQSTDADGTMNFLYNHNGIDFKMGPIGGTGAHLTSTGGYNAHVLSVSIDEYTSKGSIEEPEAVNILMSTDTVNSSNGAWAGLFPVKITYADETTVTKYVLSTVLHPENMTKFMDVTGGSSSTTGDGDRLAKTVIYVPKTTDISTGANIAAAEQYLSESNSASIVGKAITLDDVKFPNDDLIIKGESVLFGDFNHVRTNAFNNPRQWCPVGYVDFLQIPVDQKVASVKMVREIAAALNWKKENGEAAAIKNGNTAYIPVTIEGANSDYLYFAKLGRLCENAEEVYAVTISEKSYLDKIYAIEERIEKLSDKFVQKETEEIIAIKEAIKELIDGGVVLESDFDAKLYAKLEDLYEQYEEFKLYGEDIKEIIAAIDNLPESYSKEAGIAAAEVKSIIDSLTTMGVTEDYIKSLTDNYGRYESYLALHNEWLNTSNSQERIKINWQEKNPLTSVDMFEFGTVQSVDEIAYKQGIVMSSNNTTHYPATVPDGSFIGFYNTTSVKKNYPNTFPDKYGEYYVTPSNNIQYSYSGISEEIGDITYNAGLVSPSNSYEIAFDGSTKYNQVSFLMSGITYLSGEWSRHTQVAKTTVYFADGTSKEQFHIVGPFCYGYRMNLYSTLEDKSVMYSEYIGNNVIGQSVDRTWYPNEVNIDEYFKMGDGIRIYYANQADGTRLKKIGGDTTLGYATAITINTNNKPVDRVAVSYATVDEIKALGGVTYDTYTTKETKPQVISSKDCYYIPIDSQQLKNITGYEADRDYYISVIHSTVYPVYLHAVTASKTTATSYSDDIAKLEAKIETFPEEFDVSVYEELKEVKRRIDFLLNQGVSKGDFDSALMDKYIRLSEYNLGADGSYEVHVSPYGNDNGSGSENDPLKTLDGARLFVRNLVKDRPVNVIFHEGTYYLDKTVVFTIDDSGKEGFPVTYKADGNAVFTTANSVDFNDFTLVKEGEDSRIPTDLIGKIYKIDLNKQGIYPGAVPVYRTTYIDGDGFEDVNFFVNDKEQLVSQWPNGEGNYDTWVSIEDNNINAAVIKVDALRSKNWQGEKHAYFEGYPSVDYSNERNNLTIDGDLLKFKNAARFSPDENHSRRYKVKHLLSELDMPGEWYLDRDTNIFYYYPTEDFDENANIQFSSVKLDAVNVINADYVNFDGIKFDKIRGTAFTAGGGVEELNLYNCEFKNISNRAVSYKGTNNYNGDLGGIANYLDAAKNCEVRSNRFINIGETAIYFAGGERETLSNGNNVIANNYIYNASNKLRCNPNIQVSGAYNYALNNEVHMGTFHAINYSGNENVLAFNELYNMLRDTGDCGVIYNGRQLATRGTEIAYNYIHDYKHLDERTKDKGVGVYLDDRLSGISVHHNIIFANGIGEDANGIQNGGGQHNKINYNTIVDADETMTRINRFIEDYKNIADCTAFDEIIRISGMAATESVRLDDGCNKTYDMLGKNKFYFERYPEMYESIETLLNPNETVPTFVEKYKFILTLPEYSEGGKYGNLSKDLSAGNDLTKYRLLSLKSTIGNEYIGNISNTPWAAMTNKDASGNVYDVYTEFGSDIREDNVQNATKDIFVNPEKQDFRIKGSTNGGALDESFNLSTIGIQEDGTVAYDLGFELNDVKVNNAKTLPSEYKEFNLTYPENNGRVDDKKNITFMWERPVSSDYFTLEIATDPQMSNIVYKNENSYYNFETVTTLPENVDTFYWRVTARNLGKDDGSVWQNSDGVNVFHTYDMAIVEMPATVPFDIEDQFNVDVFNNEGETHDNSSNLGGKNKTLGMYNLTNFKRIVPADGYVKYGDTIYKFPQVGYETNTNNAISTGETSLYTYTLKADEQANYDKIKLAISASKHMEDYEITVNYTDKSKTVAKVYLYQYYTTYNGKPGYDIILMVDGVDFEGEPVSPSNKNKIYEAVIDTEETKTVESITFESARTSLVGGTTNSVYIFAMTGVKTERKLDNGDVEKPIVLNNYSGEEKDVVIVITGNDNGKFRAVLLEDKVTNSFVYPIVTVTIPAKVYEWTDRKVFIWEDIIDMNSLSATTTFFK